MNGESVDTASRLARAQMMAGIIRAAHTKSTSFGNIFSGSYYTSACVHTATTQQQHQRGRFWSKNEQQHPPLYVLLCLVCKRKVAHTLCVVASSKEQLSCVCNVRERESEMARSGFGVVCVLPQSSSLLTGGGKSAACCLCVCIPHLCTHYTHTLSCCCHE